MNTDDRDQLDQLDWMTDALLRLLAVDSTTGKEGALVPALTVFLTSLGAHVELQPVEPGRSNVWAFFGAPRVLFTSHLDTVPPWFPPRAQAGVIHGRGACDAKGQIVAQLAAIKTLLASGVRDVAWLGVVAEETDSKGAHAALEWIDRVPECRVVIDGEPTDGMLATGQRGLERYRLRCRGRAAHSGTPEEGRSAIWMLIDWLDAVRREHAGAALVDPELGPELLNVGTIAGGEAANVVPAAADAIVLARTVPGSSIERLLEHHRPDGGSITLELSEAPAIYSRHDGFPRAVMPFGSDAPILRPLANGGDVVLTGPGSIRVAHSVDEHITLVDLAAGAAQYVLLAQRFLERAERASARPNGGHA